MRLYVAGQTAKSLAAVTNLKRVCEEHLAGRYEISVIDLLQNPQLAASDQILAIPTLVRRLPEPLKRIIGDLSNLQKVLVGLDIQAEVLPAMSGVILSAAPPTGCGWSSPAARSDPAGQSTTSSRFATTD